MGRKTTESYQTKTYIAAEDNASHAHCTWDILFDPHLIEFIKQSIRGYSDYKFDSWVGIDTTIQLFLDVSIHDCFKQLVRDRRWGRNP